MPVAIDIPKVAYDAAKAAMTATGQGLMAEAPAALHAFQLLAQAEANIHDLSNDLTKQERVWLEQQQKIATIAVLQGFTAISYEIAAEAFNAALEVILNAITAVVGTAVKI